jgi:hypothetical protein
MSSSWRGQLDDDPTEELDPFVREQAGSDHLFELDASDGAHPLRGETAEVDH